jgi:hypothetical protein
MPSNLEEFHEQKQVRERRHRNLFMRLIEINDDLWHQIRLELEIYFLELKVILQTTVRLPANRQRKR